MGTSDNVKGLLIQLLGNAKFDIARVVEIVTKVTDSTENALRVIGYVTDGINMPEVNPTCELNDVKMEFVKYNILTNLVSWKGIHEVTRYFAKGEDVPTEGSVYKNPYDLPGRSRKDDAHTIAVKIGYKESGEMQYDMWQNQSYDYL